MLTHKTWDGAAGAELEARRCGSGAGSGGSLGMLLRVHL